MGLTTSQILRVTQLRNSMTFDAMLGNYKGFKSAKKEYASLAVKDFDTVLKLPKPSVTVPLFSTWGLNMLSVRIRDFFRVKTKDEKLLKQMGKEELAKRKINHLV